MNQTLKPLRDPRLDQAEMLCDLIIIIRRILVQPMQNHRKLACIAEAVDELAPPPPPGTLTAQAATEVGHASSPMG